MNSSTCRYCGAAIMFAETPKGRMMPLDPRPNRDGNVVLEIASSTSGQQLRLLRAVVVGRDERADEPHYMHHRATCANPPPRRGRARAGMRYPARVTVP